MLDGINKGGSKGKWKAVKSPEGSSLSFTINGNTVVANDNCVYFNREGMISTYSTALSSYNSNTCTVECVYQCDYYSPNNLMLVFVAGGNTYNLNANNDTIVGVSEFWSGTKHGFAHFHPGASTDRWTFPNNLSLNNTDTRIVQLSNSNGFINGNSLVASSGGVTFRNNGYIRLGGLYYYNKAGGNSYTYKFEGKIYAVRMYNRQLTAEEMRTNALNDIQRFNLNITLPTSGSSGDSSGSGSGDSGGSSGGNTGK